MLQLLKDVDKLSNNAPIGVFDSGLGGLTVWREAVSYTHLTLPTIA